MGFAGGLALGLLVGCGPFPGGPDGGGDDGGVAAPPCEVERWNEGPREWSLPDYGTFSSGSFAGRGRFAELADRFSDGLNYAVVDLTGDGAPDLVVTERGTDVTTGPGAAGLSQTKWLVFENTGTGFSTTPREWSLPDYGTFPSGSSFAGRGRFAELVDRFSDGLNYAVVDLTGDGAPDLVVTERGSDVTTGPGAAGLSQTKWLVFENTGTGFSTTPREWSLPDYGTFPSGSSFAGRGRFAELADRFSDGLNYAVLDLTGDGAPDLVVTERGSDVTTGPGAAGLSQTRWLVFENTRTGFSSTPREWSLPDYGTFPSGSSFAGRGRFAELFDRFSDGLNYAVVDLTGGGAPDLIVTERGSDVTTGPGAAGLSQTKWLVFENTGTGFSSTPREWSLPDYGTFPSGSSFAGRGRFAELFDRFSDGLNFGLASLRSGRSLDLVVTERGSDVTTGPGAAGLSQTRWLVFENDGSGFSTAAREWTLPDYGTFPAGSSFAGRGRFAELFDRFSDGLNYALLDLTGNGAFELVVTERGSDVTTGPGAAGLSQTKWLVFSGDCR